MDKVVEEIRDEHYARIRQRDCYLIEKTDYGFKVHDWSADGIGPSFDYDTPQEAVARVAQIIGLTEPVMPQNWPQPVCVGTIETK